jgi:hypothetical protein
MLFCVKGLGDWTGRLVRDGEKLLPPGAKVRCCNPVLKAPQRC